ncbi:HEPN domain-containing protein [Pseudomonas sp. RIT-To-2]|uniref:HEPN domain-containing protein n=1 Tax=Pseudomonas sp. RIT-To-2 TaxID=3462541 RepID=UPI002412EABD
MTVAPRLNEKAIVRSLRYWIPKYKDLLAADNADGGQGAFSIFELNDTLLKALFSTEYAREHLDYEFFMAALHHVIVTLKIDGSQHVVDALQQYVVDHEQYHDWVSVYPISFNSIAKQILGRPEFDGILRFGRFRLVSVKEGFEAFQEVMRSEFGVSSVDPESYRHQSTQAEGALHDECFLAFHSQGSEDVRDAKARQRLAFFCSLAEVFSTINEPYGGRLLEGGRKVQHAFHIRTIDGAIDREVLRTPSRLNIDASCSYFDFLTANDFEWYCNRVFCSGDKVLSRFKNALASFSRGYARGDNVVRFMSFVIAMEELFIFGEKVWIKARLSRFVSSLCFPPAEQDEAAKKVEALYSKRSQAVHAGGFNPTAEQVDQAQHFAALAIFKAFEVYKGLTHVVKPGDIEKRYFQTLECLAAVEREST